MQVMRVLGGARLTRRPGQGHDARTARPDGEGSISEFLSAVLIATRVPGIQPGATGGQILMLGSGRS